MKKATVTVLMPVYNAEKYLDEAIKSILEQSFKDFELLIIDDGSRDKSAKIIDKYKQLDQRIRVLTHPKNKGLIYTLNEGLEEINSPFTARMDSDDIALPARLEKQVSFLKADPKVAVVASHVTAFDDETGKELQLWPEEQKAETFSQIRSTLPRANCIAHPSIMARTDVIKKYQYKSSQQHIEDYDLWLRMVADGLIIKKITTPLLRYRVTKTSITGSDNGPKRLMSAKRRFITARLAGLHFGKFERSVLSNLLHDYYRNARNRASRWKNARIK